MNPYESFKVEFTNEGKSKVLKFFKRNSQEAEDYILQKYPNAKYIEITQMDIDKMIEFETNRVEKMKNNLISKYNELIKLKRSLVEYRTYRNQLLKNDSLMLYRILLIKNDKKHSVNIVAIDKEDLMNKVKEMYIINNTVELKVQELSVDIQIQSIEKLIKNLENSINIQLDSISLREMRLKEHVQLKRKYCILNSIPMN